MNAPSSAAPDEVSLSRPAPRPSPAGPGRRRGREPSTLRRRLLLLVAACVVPVVLFNFGDSYLEYRGARAEAGRRMVILARSLALVVERDLQGRLGVLQALASSKALQDGDIDGFRSVAAAVAAQQPTPGASILLLREDGKPVMDTAAPPGEQPPATRGAATAARWVFATGQPAVSDLFLDPVRREPGVVLQVPVLGRNGEVAYSLALHPTTGAFADLVSRQRLPETSIGAIFDGHGVMVAHSRAPERFVGRPAGPVLLPRLLSEREGVLETNSRDGVPSLVAFSRIDPFGWTAAVGVPLAELAAPAWNVALRTLASGLVFLLAGLGLALLVARRITGPIASLGGLAAAADRDEAPAAPRTGLAEVDRAAEALVSGTRERRAAKAALRESGFRLRLALDASQLGTWRWEAGRGALSGDARCKALFGLPPDAPVDYAVWAAAIEPEDRPAAEAAAARALDPADPHDEFDREYRVRRADDGRIVWLHAVGRAAFAPDPARPAGRRPVRIHGTILDVTERRATEERQALLMREVDHRAKNALAVALSLVRLAPRDDAARFAAGVEGRIAAMARAHSLLAAGRWGGADLRALATGELAAYAGRVDLGGPPARLSADAAQPVAMLLHELATNAAKHGALSAPSGRVALRWDFGPGPGGDAGRWLRLRWEETGGPAVARPPARGGFGSRLLGSLAERQLGGRLALDWRAEGLRADLALPPRHAAAVAGPGETKGAPAVQPAAVAQAAE